MYARRFDIILRWRETRELSTTTTYPWNMNKKVDVISSSGSTWLKHAKKILRGCAGVPTRQRFQENQRLVGGAISVRWHVAACFRPRAQLTTAASTIHPYLYTSILDTGGGG